MEGSNCLISESLLFLGVGEGFRGIRIGGGRTGGKGELRSEFFLAECDGFGLPKLIFSTKMLRTTQTVGDLVLPCLGLRC